MRKAKPCLSLSHTRKQFRAGAAIRHLDLRFTVTVIDLPRPHLSSLDHVTPGTLLANLPVRETDV